MTPTLISTTFPTLEEATRVAHRLVDEELVACVQILPGIRSVYKWKGEVEEENEVLVLLKTPANRIEEVERRVHELHSYETPEFIGIEVDVVSDGYRSWIEEVTR